MSHRWGKWHCLETDLHLGRWDRRSMGWANTSACSCIFAPLLSRQLQENIYRWRTEFRAWAQKISQIYMEFKKTPLSRTSMDHTLQKTICKLHFHNVFKKWEIWAPSPKYKTKIEKKIKKEEKRKETAVKCDTPHQFARPWERIPHIGQLNPLHYLRQILVIHHRSQPSQNVSEPRRTLMAIQRCA